MATDSNFTLQLRAFEAVWLPNNTENMNETYKEKMYKTSKQVGEGINDVNINDYLQ
jgi:hypothetical protein